MEKLKNEDLVKINVGANECGQAIIYGAMFGSLFGGAGTLLGGIVAATGPECLGWW
jgi:hypothetical protein